MTKFTESDLVENQELRIEHLERIEVLEGVKEIILLGNSKVLHAKLVAEYYEVPEETIKTLYKRNREELDSNGALILRGEELKEFKTRVHDELALKGLSSLTIFSKRALLNVGMLLRDSVVAKEVRSRLLDGFELLTDEQKTQSVTDEQLLLLNIIQSTTIEDRAVHLSEYNNYKNQHINELNATIKEQEPKVESYESFINADGYQTINQASKTLKIGRNKLFEFLRNEKVFMSDNTPYQRFVEQEYFVVKQVAINKGNFSKIHPQPFVTAKGIDYISKLLKKNSK